MNGRNIFAGSGGGASRISYILFRSCATLLYNMRMENLEEEIWELHKEYFDMFGVLPPVSPDGNFYSPELVKKIKAAIGSGKAL